MRREGGGDIPDEDRFRGGVLVRLVLLLVGGGVRGRERDLISSISASNIRDQYGAHSEYLQRI